MNLSSTTLSTRLKEARTTGLAQIRAAEEGPEHVIVYGFSRRGRKVIEVLRGLR